VTATPRHSAASEESLKLSPAFRRPRLERLSTLWLVTLAVVLAACTQAPAASRGTPLPAATASPATSSTAVVFASKSYRYSITLPIGWVARPAFASWDGYGAPNAQDVGVDLFGPAGEIKVYGSVKAFASAAPTTSPLDKYVAFGIQVNFRFHGDTCPQTPDWVEPVTIGGQPGTLVAWNCGTLINTAFAVVNGYGYRFSFRDSSVQAATDPADKAMFTTMLRSVVFH
jgi:hypothetical protein